MNIKEITNRAPTKQRNTHYYSKIGNWSFFGDYKGQRVKVYSVQNREQIDLRVFIDKHKLGKYFPKVVASNGKFIVEEFIEGLHLTVDGYIFSILIWKIFPSLN